MKKTFVRLLCLVLCLMLPASALAEPLPWLRPFIDRMAGTGSSETVLTFQVDGAALLDVLNAALDAREQEYYELYESYFASHETEEQETLDSLLASVKRQNALQRSTYNMYVPAVAALLNETSITMAGGQNSARYEICIGGQHWVTLEMVVRPEEGDALVMSDLFPSYVLRMQTMETASLSSLISEAGGNLRTFQIAARAVQTFLFKLDEWEDYHFLNAAYDVFSKGLEKLEAEGLARREGDALVYEFTLESTDIDGPDLEAADALNRLFNERKLAVDERTYRLANLYAQIGAADETDDEEIPEEAALPVLGEDASEEDYLNAFFSYRQRMYSYANEAKRIYTMTDNEITCENDENNAVHYRYDDSIGDAGTLEKLTEEYPWLTDDYDYDDSQKSAWRLTPDTLEYHLLNHNSEAIIAVSADKENEIVLSFTENYYNSGFDDMAEGMTLRLRRDEDGQEWTLTTEGLSGAMGISDLFLTLSFDNAMSRVEETIGVSGVETPFLRLGGDVQYSKDARPAPDVTGLTIVSSDTEEAKGLYAELRAVGVKNLNRLILTGLPADARPLMTPLLGFMTTLSQLDQQR